MRAHSSCQPRHGRDRSPQRSGDWDGNEPAHQSALLEPLAFSGFVTGTFTETPGSVARIDLAGGVTPDGITHKVWSLEYLPPELVPQIPVMKNSIVDVRCMDAHGRHFIVELRVLWLRFLTEIQDQATEVPAEILQDADIREAVECLQESAFTPAELDAYDRYWDQVRVERTLLADSLAEGEQIGLEKRSGGRPGGRRADGSRKGDEGSPSPANRQRS